MIALAASDLPGEDQVRGNEIRPKVEARRFWAGVAVWA